MALGLGGLVQKATSFRSIVRKGLQAWYKSDTTQAPLGEEEVANGNFSSSSNWTTVGAGWAIQYGKAVHTWSGAATNLQPDSVLVSGRKYKTTLTVSDMTTGALSVRIGPDADDQVLSITSNGTYTVTGTSGGTVFRLRAQSSFDGSVSNVSLRECVNSVRDYSSNVNNGVLYSGTCLSFDGSNDKIDFGNPGYSMKTVAFWINLDSTTEKVLQLTSSQSVEVSSGTITLNGTWTGSTVYVNAAATSTITASNWNRVVITITSAITVNDFELGNISTNFGDFDIADLQIYDSVWSASDVTYDYNNPDKDVFDNSDTSILSSNCKALYRLNEGTGTRVYNAAPVLGSELVVDGDWSLYDGATNWSIDDVNNIFTSDGGSGSIRNAGGSSSVSSGKYYKATFEILERTAGSVKLFSGSGSDQTPHRSTVGVHTYVFEALSTSVYLNSSGFNGSVGSVSIKEVTLSDSYAITGASYITAQPYIPQHTMSSYSKKMIFDGSDDSVGCGSDSTIDDVFDGSGGTWSCWVSAKTEGESNNGNVITKGNVHLRVTDDGGSPCVKFLKSFDGTVVNWRTDLDLTYNKLMHIAVTYDADSVSNDPKIYINGVEQTITESETPSGTRDSDASNNFVIGGSSSNNYDGFIDEVSIFNKILTETEVQEIFNNGLALDCRDHSASSNLIAYWRNSGIDTWDDLSTNSNDGTVSGSPTTIKLQEVPHFNKDSLGLPMNRVRQKGLNLDGDSYVQADDDSSLGAMDDGFTCAFWYRHFENIDTSNYSYLVTKGTGLATNVDHGFAASVYNNKIYADLNTADGRFTVNYTIGAASSSSPVWYYITATYNGSDELELYIDATSRGTDAVTGSVSATAEAYPITIGTDKNYYSGEARAVVDEVKWYNRVLTQAEINRNYKASKSKHSSTSNWSDDFGDGFV